MSLSKTLLAWACAAAVLQLGPAAAQAPHNLILFVPAGLRAQSVTPQSAPAMAAIRNHGVNFANPHSLFPTFTMANASGLATGHFLGDTGTFSNTIFTGYAVAAASGSMTPFIEDDPILGDIDAHFSGNFVDEDTILLTARHQGFSTAAIGKLGPTLKNGAVAAGTYPKRGNGLLGADPANPQVAVASIGGSDLVYIPGKDRALTGRVIDALLAQDYVSG